MINNPIQFEKWDQWCECLGQHVSTCSCPKNLRDTIQRLRAENERLREALEKIAQHDMQAVAMDALQPGTRIREEKK